MQDKTKENSKTQQQMQHPMMPSDIEMTLSAPPISCWIRFIMAWDPPRCFARQNMFAYMLNACKCQQMTCQIQVNVDMVLEEHANRKVRQVEKRFFFSHQSSFLSQQINAPMPFLQPWARTNATCNKNCHFFTTFFFGGGEKFAI